MERTDEYINWSQLGDNVTINSVNAFYKFNADLVEMTHSAGNVDSSFQRQVGKSGMDLFSMDYNCGSIDLVFYVLGRSKEEALRLASDLVKESGKCLVRTMPDLNSEYDCVLSSYSVDVTGIDRVLQVSLNLDCVRRLPKMRVAASDATSVRIDNQGSIASGCRIEVTSSVARTNVEVAGIVIDSLKAGMPFVIDGFEGEVMENGINKILETDLAEFPKVEPGVSNMTSNYALDWKVEWYPTFIV